MGRAGRLQGDPRGETAEANALALFLRELTKGRTVRELARSYGSGKTTWSDYRSGLKIVPWELLERVVATRVRDERGRTELLARARQLHASARAAEAGAGRAIAAGTVDGETAKQMRGAEAQLADSEDIVRRLLGLTARLQSELDDALRRAEGRAGAEKKPAASAGMTTVGGIDYDPLDDNLDGARELPPERGAAPPGAPTFIDDSAAKVGAPLDAEGGAWKEGAQGGELVRRGVFLPIPRDDSSDVTRIGSSIEVRRIRIPCRRSGSPSAARMREATAVPDRVVRGQVVGRMDHTVGGRSAAMALRWRASPAVPLRLGWVRRVLLIVCVITGLGVTATGVDQAPWPRPGSEAPAPPGPVPEAVPPKSATAVASIPADHAPEAGREPPGPRPSSRLPAASPKPTSSPALPDVRPPVPPRPGQVPAAASHGVYAIAADGRSVVRWSGNGTEWTTIGGPAKELYAGRAGVFATDPRTGELRVYGGAPGAWKTISERAASFAVSGTDLYRVAEDHSAVHRWDRATGAWNRVGGPAGRLYGGGAGLFATDPVDGRIFAYEGKGDSWSYAGAAGADFAVSDEHLYGLNPERSGVFRWSGRPGEWSAVGGPAGALFAGPSDLYATNDTDGGLWRYREGGWARVGEAGVACAALGERLYRLDKDRAAVWEWEGRDWRRIGGPVRALVVAR